VNERKQTQGLVLFGKEKQRKNKLRCDRDRWARFNFELRKE
jgi:hypothetical protein